MRRKIEPLLCELHAHTTWSDGALPLSALIDLYGRNAFDVLCITDHVHRRDDPWLPADAPLQGVHAGNHAGYLAEIEAQAARARREYDLLVVPGLELSYNDLDPNLAAHSVAVGCRAFVGVDEVRGRRWQMPASRELRSSRLIRSAPAAAPCPRE